MLITPSGYRLPFQVPHYTKEYCNQKEITHRTTAESAAELIRSLPLPEEAEVIVLGDTAYDAKVVRDACQERNYPWIFPINLERVYDGPKGARPQVRSRLKDWTSLSLAMVLYREWHRAKQLTRRGIKPKVKCWWTQQRLHGLCEAVCQHAERRELKFLSD